MAAKRPFARGSEPRYYYLYTLREVFGVEACTVLYGHAEGRRVS
jgi:hypothetical protein